MKINLADNIRAFRKQRSLTQEQLSEVLGVTAGAVYKWEAKLSVPDLSLIVEMADFFDTSVDVLLGYEMRDNHQEAAVVRLKQYLHDKDGEGISEAVKFLKKYPNSFEIVYRSAVLYQIFGLEKNDKSYLNRALELFSHSLLLLAQNKDPKISEMTIYGEMAEVYISMGDAQKAVELLKKYNAKGIYNDMIGLTLAGDCDRPEDAVPFLSDALIGNMVSMVRIVTGYFQIFYERKDYGQARDILLWEIGILSGLREEGKYTFLDKTETVFLACCAYAQIKTGDREGAENSLKAAKELAECFDHAPNYDADQIRFIVCREPASAHDNLGVTAMDALERTVSAMNDEGFSALWEEVKSHE